MRDILIMQAGSHLDKSKNTYLSVSSYSYYFGDSLTCVRIPFILHFIHFVDEVNAAFDKDHLKSQIEAGGGIIVETVDDKLVGVNELII